MPATIGFLVIDAELVLRGLEAVFDSGGEVRAAGSERAQRMELGRTRAAELQLSGISPGHPLGPTGGRILPNMLREMQHRHGRYG